MKHQIWSKKGILLKILHSAGISSIPTSPIPGMNLSPWIVISRPKNSSTRKVRWRMLSSSEIWNSSWKLLNLTRDLATIASGCPATGPKNIFKVEVFHQEHFTNTKLNVNTDRKVTEDEETEVLILFFTC